MSILFNTLFFSVIITISLVPLFSKLAVKLHAMDIPDSRKIHKNPIPRVGGVAMAVGMFVSVLVFMPRNYFVVAFLLGASIIVVFGLADDMVGLGYKAKFTGQLVAALIVILFGKVKILTLGNLVPYGLCLSEIGSVILTLLIIVGVTNAINLADGLDGLAAGICLMAFLSIAYLAYVSGMQTILYLAVSIAGVIFGFLRFNTHPATIFMGDAGSQLLGFSGIVLAIKLTQESLILSPVLPLFLFGLPIFDTLTVMFQRLIQKKSPFLPDRNHMHHRLMGLELYHTEAVFIIYLIQSLLIIFALFFKSSSGRILFLVYLIFSFMLFMFFYLAEKFNYRLKRYDFIEHGLKAKLRDWRSQGVVIKFCFFVVKFGLATIFIIIIMLPSVVPTILVFYSTLAIFAILMALIIKKIEIKIVVRFVVYLLGPFILYLPGIDTNMLLSSKYAVLFDFFFLILAFFSIMTLKFTRRKRGFKFNTLDFLILLLVVILLILPDNQIHSNHLGILASKIIILFFSFEILVGELRGNWKGPALTVLSICSLVVLRGLGLF